MSFQLSKNLSALLCQFETDIPIDLSVLADQVVELFEKNKEAVKILLNRTTGVMPPGTLYRHLHDCIVTDSAVRDVLTVGHLSKLLSRLDVLIKISNPAIIGLPHSIFDERSQFERAEFFATGSILPIDADILNNDAVKKMLQRENDVDRISG